MNEKTIAQLGWTKRWAGSFSLLGCSYWGVQYIQTTKRVLGKGYKHVLFTHKEGITTCYRIKSETKSLGEHLTKKVLADNDIIIEWSEKLKKQADTIRSIISKPIKSFLGTNKFLEFEQEFDTFYPLSGANNTVSDYLPPDLLKKYRNPLEEARKYSETVYNETEEFFKRLTKNVADKKGYDDKNILTIFREELANYFKEGKLPQQNVFKQRYEQSALFFNNDKRFLLLGNSIDTLETKIAEFNGLTAGAVKGNTAYPGKVKGVARIIRDPKKIGIFNNGDILITGTTRPDFVPLMKKAGAIITDAGGILSHAAIVSRELHKPCIIGTETATKAFKNGDIIEVDADKGIARKIE